MQPLNQNEHIGVREFFADMGVIGDKALHAFSVVLGAERERWELEEIRTTTLRGCYRDHNALGRGLRRYFTVDDYEGRLAIASLLPLRNFYEVPLTDAARQYCGEQHDVNLHVLARELGDTVPEWFFPALCLLARNVCRSHGWGGSPARVFEDWLSVRLNYWGYGDSSDVLGTQTRAIARPLSHMFLELTMYVGPCDWVLPSGRELEDAKQY